MTTDLTRDLARALGLPTNTAHAVLTLDPKHAPRLEITAFISDRFGKLIIEPDPAEPMAKRIAQVKFMLRLERFPEITP